MITIVTIGLIIWAISAYRRQAAEKRRQEEIARLQAEMRRRKAEEAYLKKVQREQAQEQARLAKQVKQNTERILKLEARMDKAEADIQFLTEDIAVLEDLRHPKAMELQTLRSQKKRDDYNGIGNPARDAKIEKLAKEVRQYDKQIHAAQQKIRSAEAVIEQAESQLQQVA